MKKTEFSLLATALLNRERIGILMEHDPDDLFTDPESISIFDTIREMLNDGIDPDLATLAVRLQDRLTVTGPTIIAELAQADTTINFKGLLSEIICHNSKSKIKNFCRDLYKHIQEGGTPDSAAEMLTEFQDKLTGPDPDLFASMKDMAAMPLDDVFSQHEPIPTGIKAIDGFIPGLYPGQLIIPAARPGLGKTSLALQISGGLPGAVLFFSLEMSRQELYARRLSFLASVEAWKIETRKVNEFEIQRVIKAADEIRQADNNLIIIDRLSDLTTILNTARRFIRRGGVTAIFVDYLQLIAGGRGETRNLKIADITRRLKQYAMENAVPVILLSQLNRAIEYRDREPVLSDLRDSGAIEQDADVVMFIHETVFEDDSRETNLIFAKNRKGRTGKTNIKFNKKFTRFENEEDDFFDTVNKTFLVEA